LADFFVIAGEAVMTHTRAAAGATSNFKAAFRYGRTTASTCSFARGRLPNPELGCSASKAVFIDNLDLTWDETAALMGVHTLGRTHLSNSGYHGWWSDPQNSRLFNNNYYVSLLSKSWKATSVGGAGSKHQYDRVDIGSLGHHSPGNEMMLNTDMCLAFLDVPAGTAIAEGRCNCTWLMPNAFLNVIMNSQPAGDEHWCGTKESTVGPLLDAVSKSSTHTVSEGNVRAACCPHGSDTCDSIDRPGGVAIESVVRFAENDTLWYEEFQAAWTKATEKGFSHTPNMLLSLKDTCASADSTRTVPIPDFPNTTATTTSSTTAAIATVAQKVLDRWYMAGSMEACSSVCQRHGKQCNIEGWNTYGADVETYEGMRAIVAGITLLNRSQNPGVPGTYRWRADGCRSHSGCTPDIRGGFIGYGTTPLAQQLWGNGTLRPPAAGVGQDNDGRFCERNHNPAGSESFMVPAMHPFRFGEGAHSRNEYFCVFSRPGRSSSRRYPSDHCDKMYHGAGWRRLCVCTEKPTATVPETTPTDASACLRNGVPDPECCAGMEEASCVPGFELSTGPVCMATHDYQYMTTECRPTTVTTSTSTIAPIADGYHLAPRGQPNCTEECESHGMKCTVQGFQNAASDMYNGSRIREIIGAIGRRDWLGIESGEGIFPHCPFGDQGPAWGAHVPYFWGMNPDWANCHERDTRWPLNAAICDLADQERSRYYERTHPWGWRRLCKCVTPAVAEVHSRMNIVETEIRGIHTKAGDCTCPNGEVYKVGCSIKDATWGSNACIGGVSGTCDRTVNLHNRTRVTCTPAA